jgi:hypothetical protein
MANKLSWTLILILAVFAYACNDRPKDGKEDGETESSSTDITVSDPVVSDCSFSFEIDLLPSDASDVQVDSVKYVFHETEFEFGLAGPMAEVLPPGTDKPDTFAILETREGEDGVHRINLVPYILIPPWYEDDPDYSYIGDVETTEPPNGTWVLTMLTQCEDVNLEGLTLTIGARYTTDSE